MTLFRSTEATDVENPFRQQLRGAEQAEETATNSSAGQVKFPSLFVVAVRKRGQSKWTVSGFRPVLERAKAEAKMRPYHEKHGSDYEYRVMEYLCQDQ